MRKLLGLTRYAVIVPALAAIIGALLLMAQGSIEMIVVAIDAVTEGASLKETIVEVLTAVDAILLGTVLLVIGYGLYELFIDAEIDVPEWLRVENLDDLKSKLIGVVVAIIAVVFVGVFVDSNRAGDVISYGVGAGALVVGLAIFAWATGKGESDSAKLRRELEVFPEPASLKDSSSLPRRRRRVLGQFGFRRLPSLRSRQSQGLLRY
jgi:uncharacterized membrane protein YqhA